MELSLAVSVAVAEMETVTEEDELSLSSSSSLSLVSSLSSSPSQSIGRSTEFFVLLEAIPPVAPDALITESAVALDVQEMICELMSDRQVVVCHDRAYSSLFPHRR